MFKYDKEELKKALLTNSQEVLPVDEATLDKELELLVTKANESGERINHYIGFEVSGLIHIGTAMPTAMIIRDLTRCGVHCTIWIADYHTYLNKKLDGKFETIRYVARSYFGPVIQKCLQISGCDMSLVEIAYADEYYQKKSSKEKSFWEIDIACGGELTLSRVLKSVSITGKEAGEGVEFGTLRYPVMQVADAFFLGTHIVHAGMDQRKCHVLMREVATSLPYEYSLTIGGEQIKPIVLHHNLLLSLEPPKEDSTAESSKMSKSKPQYAVWVHDSAEEIFAKLKKAYCPMADMISEGDIEKIPLLQWSRLLIYPSGRTITINSKVYSTYQAFYEDYKSGLIHPLDLKKAVAFTFAEWFAPIREFVLQSPEGMNKVKQIKGI